MARLAQDVVSVTDEQTAAGRAHRPSGGRRRPAAGSGPLGGPYGASFTGLGTPGLRLERRWTRPGVHPYDEVTWELRTASITNESGKVVFEQRDVEVPSFWSQLATNVVVSKYFRGHLGTPERERSVKQLIDRVVNTICGWAERQHYFATPDDLETFRAELTHLLLHQKMSFNSPVWFNVGIEPKPQCSACFINSVEDNMGSIMDLAKTEAMLFKYGSGAGVNLSPIRSSKERMSGGGMASGPVSFMKGYDAFAGVIKSGGKTRRAAKMVILNVDHPDILEFIDSKANEEKKAWALIEAGYDPSFTGEAYASVFFQNANHSVRVTDEFMRAVVEDREWTVRAVTTGEPLATYRAREIWRRMAEAAWLCGDPGVQYDTTINDWHTCANTDRIYASNPCVTGDTLVATDRGWRTIESLVGETVDVIGLDGRAHRVTRVFPTGRKPVFELKTRLGYRVKITADHKVRTERGDVPVKDLRPDDVILLERPGFGRTSLAPNLAEAIGLAVGDGCLSWSAPNGRPQPMIAITMAAEEAPILARVAEEINAQKRLLRAVGAPGRGDAVHVTVAASGSRLAFASRPVVERFMEYAVLDEGAELKRFKPAVYDLDRPSLAALLRGLFTADGTVGRNPRKGAYVGLDSTSLELLVQVQRLLLAFGIKARIYENRRRGSLRSVLPDGRGGAATYPVKEVHALRISRASRLTFEREIGFAPESPKAAVLRSINAASAPRQDALRDRVGFVRPLGIEPVFDLTEPVTHHFVANGLVVHNCSEFMFLNDTACFAPETRISTPDGLRTVEELYQAQERGERILITTDLMGEHDHRRLTAHRPAIVTRVGERPVFRMTLNDGRSIRTTGDHRFLTADGVWKRLDELVPGKDRIEIRRSGNPVRFESPAAEVRRWQMLGWMTGDGVFSKGTAALVFGPGEAATAELLTEEFNRLLDEAHERAATADELDLALRRGALLTADGVFPAGGSHRSASLAVAPNGVRQVASKAQALVRLLEDRYGMRQGTATSKDVPTEVHRVPDDLKVAYLQGLFSADGTIRSSASASEPEVMLATSSPALARSVQLLLSDLGIASRISWHQPAGRTNPQGQLHITNQAARTFLALVGFPLSAEKQARAAAILARPFEGARRNPRPATVVAIEPDGTETVYDITEPVTHSVIAEGLIAHNCNLASLNLMKFVGDDGEFDVEAFRHAARVTITAQEIIVDNASYPTPKIEERSHRFRPLGLGYANLGALLMSRGLPYDSDEGRNYAAAITAIMHGEAYRQSAIIARDHGGPFVEFETNREPFLRVIRKHRDAAYRIDGTGVPAPMLEAVHRLWDETLDLGERYGYRNAQVTVLAPTGTIAFMMDCDTTGIEPDIALVKYKKLVGEGYLKIVNTTVPVALRRLGYTPAEVEEIVRYIDERETIEGAPHLRPEHLPVFDCAFKPVNGQRSIHYMGHVRMMAAVQPFLSGAISKTVNMPETATVEDIEQVYLEGWRLGLKAIAIYRDGSKKSQPLTAGKKTSDEATAKEIEELRRQLAEAQAEALKPHRRRLPAERQAVTHKFEIAGHEGYITVGLYPDGQPGEIFLKMAKEGSTVSGLMDSFATAISLALQYGVPLRDLVNKFAHVRFEPSGFTGNPEIPIAKSIVDYIFRWLGSRFLPPDDRAMLGLVDRSAVVAEAPSSSGVAAATAPAPEEGLSAIDEATHPAPSKPSTPEPPGAEPPRATAVATTESPGAGVEEPAARNGRTGNGHLPAGPGLGLSLGGTKVSFQAQADAPSCPECGSIMVRNGSCYKCLNCGATSGCS
ncbi:MAG TPA: LAGLIDADG family homing endonuclease [Candidatus Binatia bacterium]|nr:LAGLIDADG family homing endonuclease [Candidatus Binatia bacterium]